MARIFTLGPELRNLAGEKLTSGAYLTSGGRKTLAGSGGDSMCSSASTINAAFTAAAELYIRAGAKIPTTTNPPSWQLTWANSSGTVLGGIWCYNGFWRIYVGSVTVANLKAWKARSMEPGVWHRVEVHVNMLDVGGIIELLIDDEAVLSYSGDTLPTAGATIARVTASSCCDLAVNNTAGALNNSWCGEGYCVALFPKGPGNTTLLTPVPGAPNWERVNDLGDTTEYVESSLAAKYDTYDMEDLPAEAASINIALARSYAKYVTSSPGAHRIAIRSGGSDYFTSSIAVTTAWLWYPTTVGVWWSYETDPATGAAWTVPNFNAAELGAGNV